MSRSPSVRAAGLILLLTGAACTAAMNNHNASSLSSDRLGQLLRTGQEVSGRLVEGDPVINGRGPFEVYSFHAVGGQRYVLTMRAEGFDSYLTVGRTVRGITDVLASDDDSGGGTDARIRFRPPATGRYLVVAQSLGMDGMGSFTIRLDSVPPPAIRSPVEVRPGQPVPGRLNETSAMEEEEIYYERYSLRAGAGQRFEITMRSEEFDTYLVLGVMQHGEMRELQRDDDSGGGEHGTDSRLRHSVNEDGEYVIVARSFGPNTFGGYTLEVVELPPLQAAIPEPIQVGQTVRGRLTDTSPVTEEYDSPYAPYQFTGQIGQRMLITVRSEDFPTYLTLGRMTGGRLEVVGTGSSDGSGGDSRLRITLPEDGEYIIRAEAMDGDMRGAFTLTLEQLPPSVLPTPRPIERGRTVNGELRERDPELDDGQYYHLWSLSAQAGERIRISMQSEAFDTYVALGRLAGSEFVEIAATDDGGEGTNSLLEVTVEEMGIYVIRATTFFAGVPGPYTLRVDRIP